jgi:CHAT domain-containing protein
LGLDLETGADLRSEAEIHLAAGDLALSESKARAALRIHGEIGSRLGELLDLLLIAEIEAEAEHWREAGQALDGARELAERLEARSARVSLALSDARIAERRGDPGAVLRILNAARGDLTEARYDLQAEVHALRARAHARVGASGEAIEEGRSAVAAIERARGVLRSGYLRTTFLARENRAYGDLVGNLLAAGRKEEAFQVADAARGRALVEHISSAGTGAGAAGRLVGEYAEGRELLLHINELLAWSDEVEELPPAERDPGEEAFLLNELQRARSEYEALLVRAAETDPAGATVLGARSVGVADVRRALRRDEALIEYLVTEQRLHLFIVTRDGVHNMASEIPAAQLAARVRIARELSAQAGGSGATARPVLARLHRDLIAPARDSGLLRGVRRLVIVPHRELTYLPFAALLDGERGRYLVEDYTLLGVPNAAALPVLRARERTPGEPGGAPARIFAPFPDELPGTRAELEAIENALPGAVGRTGGRASENAVREALAGGEIIHLASHAVLNSAAPMFSRVEIAPQSDAGPETDGRLEVHEILGLLVRSPLVFLSGCDTGVGSAGSSRYDAGEDYVMLAQAFLFAGADNVLATLWHVEDRSAADFAAAFYEELRSSDPEVALARAQRRLLADPAYSSPFHWAAYRVTGSGGSRTRGAIAAPTSVPRQ